METYVFGNLVSSRREQNGKKASAQVVLGAMLKEILDALYIAFFTDAEYTRHVVNARPVQRYYHTIYTTTLLRFKIPFQ